MKTPTAVVTDLGTEFGVEVDRAGECLVQVFQGMVEASSVEDAAGSPEKFLAGEAGRIRRNGSVVKVAPADKSFVRKLPMIPRSYSRAVLSDRPLFYWNFDEPSGPAFEQVRRMTRDSLYRDGDANRCSHDAIHSGLALGKAADFSESPGIFRSLGMGYAALPGAWAIEFWVQFTGDRSGQSQQYLLCAGLPAGNSPAVIFDYCDSGGLDNELELFDWKGRTTKGPQIDDDRWRHVFFVFFGNGETLGISPRVDIVLDGRQSTLERGDFLGNLILSDLIVGAATAELIAPFRGRIDELAIYDLSSMTAEQIENRVMIMAREHLRVARPPSSPEAAAQPKEIP